MRKLDYCRWGVRCSVDAVAEAANVTAMLDILRASPREQGRVLVFSPYILIWNASLNSLLSEERFRLVAIDEAHAVPAHASLRFPRRVLCIRLRVIHYSQSYLLISASLTPSDIKWFSAGNRRSAKNDRDSWRTTAIR